MDSNEDNRSRRDFLFAGLTLPAAGMAATRRPGMPLLAPQAPAVAPLPPITRRTLGKTGLNVTRIGLSNAPNLDNSVMLRAIDRGINHFDTAPEYRNGGGEVLLGQALKGVRDKVVLSTKSAKTGAAAMAELEQSLRNLGTDHLDIWYLYKIDKPENVPDELVAVWEKARQQGKIRFIGLSVHDLPNMIDRILAIGKIDTVMCSYNFSMAATRDAAFARLQQAGIGISAIKTVAPVARSSAGTGRPASALRWVLKNPAVASVLLSMKTMEQLAEDVKADSETFTPADEKLLAVANEEIRPDYCRMCYQCSGKCPNGVPVAETIRYLSYADFYGNIPMGREHFQRLPQEIRDVRCADCVSCAIQCPNGVKVAERVARAQTLFA